MPTGIGKRCALLLAAALAAQTVLVACGAPLDATASPTSTPTAAYAAPTVTPTMMLAKNGDRAFVNNLAALQAEVPFTILVPEVPGFWVQRIQATVQTELGPGGVDVAVSLRPAEGDGMIDLEENAFVNQPSSLDTPVSAGDFHGWTRDVHAMSGEHMVVVFGSMCGAGFHLTAFPEQGPGLDDELRVAQALVDRCPA